MVSSTSDTFNYDREKNNSLDIGLFCILLSRRRKITKKRKLPIFFAKRKDVCVIALMDTIRLIPKNHPMCSGYTLECVS